MQHIAYILSAAPCHHILFCFHYLDRLVDHIQEQWGHCFCQGGCGARLVSVPPLSGKEKNKM